MSSSQQLVVYSIWIVSQHYWRQGTPINRGCGGIIGGEGGWRVVVPEGGKATPRHQCGSTRRVYAIPTNTGNNQVRPALAGLWWSWTIMFGVMNVVFLCVGIYSMHTERI